MWRRWDAETSPERGYYYRSTRHSAGQPIVAGWSYQWIAQVNFQRDSLTAPLDVCRVHPDENVHTVAVAQIRRVLQELPAREIDSTCGRVPILLRHELFDHPRAPVIRMVTRVGNHE